ncbi:oligopeptide/dipeptide ABC transporter ATP-binding protein, partial [Streptomyces sp. NPDC059558]|uniref:oligopeptide/dipeptide ABC transporter ATP-binding protein n=1 Tax=Streptomyces sp. NPDC059558 TaxID=3346864 RepID=UPI0036C30EDF
GGAPPPAPAPGGAGGAGVRLGLLAPPPPPAAPPPGCTFHPRCPKAQEICRTERPLLRPVASRDVACHFPGD